MKRQVFKFNDIKGMLHEDEMKGIIGGCGTSGGSGWEWAADPNGNIYFRSQGSDTWIAHKSLNEVTITAPAPKSNYNPNPFNPLYTNVPALTGGGGGTYTGSAGGYLAPSGLTHNGIFSSSQRYKPSELNVSEHLASFMSTGEGGFRDKMYDTKANDTEDWTIGYGHKVTPGEFKAGIFANRSMSKQEALGIFQSDMKIAVAAVQKHVTATLTQNQFDALVSFTYQKGQGNFQDSSVRALINTGKFDEAIVAMRHASDISGDGRVTRRREEADLFEFGDYDFSYAK